MQILIYTNTAHVVRFYLAWVVDVNKSYIRADQVRYKTEVKTEPLFWSFCFKWRNQAVKRFRPTSRTHNEFSRQLPEYRVLRV